MNGKVAMERGLDLKNHVKNIYIYIFFKAGFFLLYVVQGSFSFKCRNVLPMLGLTVIAQHSHSLG